MMIVVKISNVNYQFLPFFQNNCGLWKRQRREDTFPKFKTKSWLRNKLTHICYVLSYTLVLAEIRRPHTSLKFTKHEVAEHKKCRGNILLVKITVEFCIESYHKRENNFETTKLASYEDFKIAEKLQCTIFSDNLTKLLFSGISFF